jgi:hypothetical protein
MKIIKATPEHIVDLALMLRDMYMEVFTAYASEDLDLYIHEIIRCFNDSKQCIYTTNTLDGIVIVVDTTDTLTPTLLRCQCTRVYIKPEQRHSKLLRQFYDKLFEDYPEGSILGFTEINSSHIKVLDKRHELIAKVYKLDRSK